MLVMVLLGWNDGSQGPLLPFFQEYYHVRPRRGLKGGLKG